MSCAPLLKWYIGHNLKITVMHRPIDYVPQKIFTWFVNKVSENRHKGHQNPELAVLAEVFKLFGNSAYGKLIKALERQTTMKYTKSEIVSRKSSARCGFKIWRRLVTCTKSRHTSTKRTSTSGCRWG